MYFYYCETRNLNCSVVSYQTPHIIPYEIKLHVSTCNLQEKLIVSVFMKVPDIT